MRRVVVTGLGLVTPLACGVEETWSRLLAGKSGARPITKFKTEDLGTKIACDVPRGDGTDGTFNPDHWVDPENSAGWTISSSSARRRQAGGDRFGLRPRPRKTAIAPAC